jgi:hypothetical protein
MIAHDELETLQRLQEPYVASNVGPFRCLNSLQLVARRFGPGLGVVSSHPRPVYGAEGNQGRRRSGDESEDGGESLGEADARGLGGYPQVPFGHVVRTNRLGDILLVNTMLFAGLGTAGALAWGIGWRQRLELRWMTPALAFLVLCLWCFASYTRGYAWFIW